MSPDQPRGQAEPGVSLPIPVEIHGVHLPECNEGCDGASHLLLPDSPVMTDEELVSAVAYLSLAHTERSAKLARALLAEVERLRPFEAAVSRVRSTLRYDVPRQGGPDYVRGYGDGANAQAERARGALDVEVAGD